MSDVEREVEGRKRDKKLSVDIFSLILTTKSRDEIYDLSQKRTVPFKPNLEDRRCIRIE